MSAIILDPIKDIFTQKIFDENEGTRIGDSDNYYYIAIGRSQQWSPSNNTDITVNPSDTEREQRLFRYNMQSVKAVEAFSYVVPLYDWSSGTVYQAYNDNQVGQPNQSYYIRTSTNHVYVCLRQGITSAGAAKVSVNAPTHTTTALPQEDDGYVWKYLYTILTADANSFLTANFMPVKYVDSAALTDPNYTQKTIQDAAIAGQILGYRVINGGTGYSNASTVTITGDGTGAAAHVVASSGVIQKVVVGDSADVGKEAEKPFLDALGSGYNYASVSISGGNGNAKVVPIFGPKAGIGADARVDLRSSSIMFNIKPEGTVEGTWLVDNEYRQIGLLRNPLDSATGTKFTETQALALKKIEFESPISELTWANDIQVYGTDSDAIGWIDYFDDSATIWYHQDEDTGFEQFSVSEVCTIEGKAGTHTIKSKTDRGIDIFSGDLLFVNNFDPVTRDVDQTEDIKLVVKL